MAIDEKRIEKDIRDILLALGDDPEREGLRETPARVARMYTEVFAGMNYTNHEIAQMFNKTFEHETANAGQPDEIVAVHDIDAFSYCEHHMALMYDMKIDVGYIPGSRVIGLSKIARIVDMVTRRLQLQEKIGTDICEIMQEVTGSDSIAVKIRAKHSCMTARGIRKTDSQTVTTTFTGKFKTDPALQMRFLSV